MKHPEWMAGMIFGDEDCAYYVDSSFVDGGGDVWAKVDLVVNGEYSFLPKKMVNVSREKDLWGLCVLSQLNDPAEPDGVENYEGTV